jgi:hypothetical protein
MPFEEASKNFSEGIKIVVKGEDVNHKLRRSVNC